METQAIQTKITEMSNEELLQKVAKGGMDILTAREIAQEVEKRFPSPANTKKGTMRLITCFRVRTM